MRTCSCKTKAATITRTDGTVMFPPEWCISTDCKSYPCAHVRQWAKRHGVKTALKQRLGEGLTGS
jgi:hypothetical protein